MLDSAISPVTTLGIDTPASPERTGLRLLALHVAFAAVVAGDRATALRLIADAR